MAVCAVWCPVWCAVRGVQLCTQLTTHTNYTHTQLKNTTTTTHPTHDYTHNYNYTTTAHTRLQHTQTTHTTTHNYTQDGKPPKLHTQLHTTHNYTHTHLLRELLYVVAGGRVVGEPQGARKLVEAVADGDVDGLAKDAVAAAREGDDLFWRFGVLFCFVLFLCFVVLWI